MGFPVKIISMASDFPKALGKLCVPPTPKKKNNNK